MDWSKVEQLLNEMTSGQNQKLFAYGRRIVPYLTQEDLLQPNDFPELENHPEFRYEEGVLAGMHAVAMALQAMRKERE